MKILITGVSGMLGYDLWNELKGKHEIYGSDMSEPPAYVSLSEWSKFDITDQQDTYNKISKINPELIIHTAAFSDVDECEKNPAAAYRVNALGTRNICTACQRFDTALCYISTDYVFSGENTPEGGYKEFDRTDPQGIYGKSKYLGEFYVKHLLNKFYIIRTSRLFGKNRKNFISYVVESVKEKKKVTVVKDQFGIPTYTKDLAYAISQLVEKPLYGIFHITNSNWASRKEVVEEIFKILKESTGTVFKTRKELFFAPRPRDSTLRNFIWETEGFKPLRPWQEALREFIQSP